MLRIVNGFVYEGKPSDSRFHVTLADLGNGHREAVISRAIDWQESGPLHPDSIAAQVLRGEREDPNAEEKAEANRRRAARRAKTRCRRLCKAMGLDTLLTLTYRANQADLALCKRHLELFRKRMARALGGFAYVACFEQQKRGAWHVHMATHALPPTLKARNGVKVKSFNVVRAIWRAVVGDLGGNVDCSRRRRKGSPARIASYLSKYMLKDWDELRDGARRLQSSQAQIPERVRLTFEACRMVDLIEQAVLEVTAAGGVLCSAWVSRFGDTVYLAAEARGVDTSIH